MAVEGDFFGGFWKGAFLLVGLGRGLLWWVLEGDDGDAGVSVGWVEQPSLPARIACHPITKHT